MTRSGQSSGVPTLPRRVGSVPEEPTAPGSQGSGVRALRACLGPGYVKAEGGGDGGGGGRGAGQGARAVSDPRGGRDASRSALTIKLRQGATKGTAPLPSLMLRVSHTAGVVTRQLKGPAGSRRPPSPSETAGAFGPHPPCVCARHSGRQTSRLRRAGVEGDAARLYFLSDHDDPAQGRVGLRATTKDRTLGRPWDDRSTPPLAS